MRQIATPNRPALTAIAAALALSAISLAASPAAAQPANPPSGPEIVPDPGVPEIQPPPPPLPEPGYVPADTPPVTPTDPTVPPADVQATAPGAAPAGGPVETFGGPVEQLFFGLGSVILLLGTGYLVLAIPGDDRGRRQPTRPPEPLAQPPRAARPKVAPIGRPEGPVARKAGTLFANALVEALVAARPTPDNPFLTRASRLRRARFNLRHGIPPAASAPAVAPRRFANARHERTAWRSRPEMFALAEIRP